MWKTVKLGDVCSIQPGNSIAAKKKEELFTNVEGIPYVATKDVGFDGKINYQNGVAIPKKYLGKFKVSLPNSTLVCAEGGSAGRKIAFSNMQCCIVNKLFSIAPSNILCAKYVYYYTLGEEFQSQFKAALHGLIGGVSLKKFKDFNISFPSLAEQQRIVAKLDAAFAEIDSAIFANACNIIKANEIFSQYLSNVEADNLPLEKLINIKTGKLDSNAMVENGEFPFFTCSREIYSIDKFAFECDAVLLAGNNASGDFNVKHYEGKFNAYQRTYVLTVVDSNSLRSRYLYFQLINALSKFKKMSVGAGTKFLKIGMIRSLEIPLPPIIAQDKILVKLEKLLKLSEELHTAYNGKEIQLSSLKSAILAQELKGEAA